jgi:putative FmdB family regulatory protein
MPIYEFYCSDCHTIFNFYSKTINTKKRPNCPKCKAKKLQKQMSSFAFTGNAKEESDMDDVSFDENKMEKAMNMLAGEAEKIDEENPQQAAGLMRKLSDMTGMQLGAGMEEALSRMERGEDPEQIEAEMGDIMEGEEPFLLPEKKGMGLKAKRRHTNQDETLYEL